MCGIAGVIGGDQSNKTTFEQIVLRAHSRRGPDDHGTFYKDDCKVSMLHNRLSIIDLSDHGHQPMTKHGRTIIFNGEVYNFREIRSQLLKAGYTFESNSDTEVILSAYDKWGFACFNMFNGPLAVALYDSYKNEVVLARDRVGEKPLYYFIDSSRDVLYFGSTISFIMGMLPHYSWQINEERVVSDLIFNFWSDKSQTHVVGISSVAPGTILSISINAPSLAETNVYWQLSPQEIVVTDIAESVTKIDHILKDALKIRTELDTEIGAILSGGIDSTLLTVGAVENLPYKPKTFTLQKQGFVDDDLYYARKVSEQFNLSNNTVKVRQRDISVEKFEAVTQAMEEPVLDQVYIYINRNYEVAHKAGLKAVLNGQGSDEVFLGYLDYYDFLRDKKNYESVEAFTAFWLRQSPLSPYIRKDILHEAVNNNIRRNYLPYVSADKLNSVLRFGVVTHLPALLAQEDKQSMAWSVECRTVFTDYRLIEYVCSLSSEIKYYDGREKYLLRQVAQKYLPDYIIKRKKLGFPDLPDGRKDLIAALLTDGLLVQSELLNRIISRDLLQYPQQLPLGIQWKLCSIALMEKVLI